MAIPQDVAEDLARSLNDTLEEGSMSTTDVFSIQPLAVCQPETIPANPSSNPSSTPAASPPTHGAGALQTGTSAIKTGNFLFFHFPPFDLTTGLNLAFLFSLQLALNASHSLARSSDALDNAREEEQALKL
ncbi:hypothetical protein LIER_38441 [Lithospermum erythrorhizon]|uniref:Uncharacterized protein n=1 Tax=Lithospermum erythrorhizon TaxID=34254 RepID=A0AAV3Q0U6_LITER